MRIVDHRLFSNTSALFGLQVATWILPLVLLPYYARVFAVDLFGVVAFSLSAVQLSFVLTDFGFGLSATEDISRHRDDREHVERTLGGIVLIKAALSAVAIATVTAIPWLAPARYGDHRLLFAWCALPILGQAYQPFWFFQGLEKMKQLSLYTVSAKATYLLLALALVRSPSHYARVPVALGLSQLLAAALGWMLVRREGYRVRLPDRRRLGAIYRHSATYFVSRVAVALYTSGSVFLLGLFGTNAAVAMYSVAEQLYRAIQSVFAPVGQALFPYMVREKDVRVFLRVLAGAVGVAAIGAVVGYFVSPTVVDWVFGPDFADSVPLLYRFFLVVLVNVPGTLLGYPFMGAFDRSRIANWSVVVGSVFHVTGLAVLGKAFGLTAAAVVWLVLCTESLVLLIRSTFAIRLARERRAQEGR